MSQDPNSASALPLPHDTETMPTAHAGSVDQIRDILFGRQMSEYDARFKQLEDRLVEENQRLSQQLNKRVDAALQELEQERQQRETAFSDILDKLVKQSEELGSAQSVSERQLLDQISSLGEEMIQRIRDTAERETQRHGRIRQLFKDLAHNLDQEP